MSRTSSNSAPENHTPPLLQLQDLSIQFGGIAALREVNYKVAPGIIQSVIGPNGAGKTTLFNCISGLKKPSSGRIIFNGQALDGLQPHRIAEVGISRTFQHVALFKTMTVLENVMLGRHSRTTSGFLATGLRLPWMRREEKQIRDNSMETLALVGLAGMAHFPAGTLPLGKQKILEIARALATDPKLILLDEPAGGLNTRETEELGDLIRQICAGGTTVMLVEHDMNLIMEISHRILVMYYGAPLASGNPEEIKNNDEVIKAYLGAG
jgi:branched-chain amino acid transport system ATP-binding protein